MKTSIIKSMIPPGGWWIVDHDVKVDAPNPDALVEALAKFREINNYPPGDPENDVIEGICRRAPQCCKGIAPKEEPRKVNLKGVKPRLLDRVRLWCLDIFKTKRETVSAETTHNRTNICLNCPKRRPWDNCPSCGGAIRDIRNMLGYIAPIREDIGGCSAVGFDIGTAATLTKESIRRGSPKGDIPKECWML